MTEIVDHNPVEKWCITRSTVTIPDGGSATGIARQEPTRIAADYLANCETSSVGRALGMLGFGTQFCRDFDQEPGQVVDSPVSVRPATSGAAKPEQVAWYGQSMKRYGFTNSEDHVAIAEDIGRAPFDHLTANQLKGIVDAARSTLVVKGEDGRWAIAEPVAEMANAMA